MYRGVAAERNPKCARKLFCGGLLGAKDNVDNANKTFAEKKTIYKKSPFLVTSELAKYTKWGPDEIRKRQEELAKLAPKIWPLKWK